MLLSDPKLRLLVNAAYLHDVIVGSKLTNPESCSVGRTDALTIETGDGRPSRRFRHIAYGLNVG